MGMIPIGEINAAGDLTTAANIRRAGTQSQAAVDERITPIATQAGRDAAVQAVADDPTVAAAAAVAVEDAIDGRQLPSISPAGTGVRFQDENGHELWIGAGPDGLPDYIAKAALANTLHWYVGPDEPYVKPGGFVVWVQTDNTGTPINTLIGRN